MVSKGSVCIGGSAYAIYTVLVDAAVFCTSIICFVCWCTSRAADAVRAFGLRASHAICRPGASFENKPHQEISERTLSTRDGEGRLCVVKSIDGQFNAEKCFFLFFLVCFASPRLAPDEHHPSLTTDDRLAALSCAAL